MLTKSNRILSYLYKNPNIYPSDIRNGLELLCDGSETKNIKGLLDKLVKGGFVSHPEGYELTEKGRSLAEEILNRGEIDTNRK